LQSCFSPGVEKQNASASRAKQFADAAARKILENLRASGIDEKDIQTTFLSLHPQFNFQTVRLKINSFSRV